MSAQWRVLIADAIDRSALGPLTDDSRFEVIDAPGLSGDRLAGAMENVDAVLVRSATKITRDALARADRLSVIGRAGVGVDTIDVDAATERGIAVLTAPSGNTISAAELTFALLLALVRRVAAADRSMKAGAWDRKSFTGTELYGKTLGLVGAGRIGSEVARRARAFGMRVVAFDPYLSVERAAELEMELAPLDQVVARADAITVHVPLTDATRGLIDTAMLARAKPQAVIVNCARGGIIDEAALIDALRERRVAGAALDVYEQEPLPADHPLRTLDTVILTPHLGASTAEAQRNVAVEIADAVRGALADGDLSRAVNAPAVGGDEMRRAAPLLRLGTTLGMIAAALVRAPIQDVEVVLAGGAPRLLRPLVPCVLVGLLRSTLGAERVNFVNAAWLAKGRGITVTQAQREPHADAGDQIEIRVRADHAVTLVAGALLDQRHPRLVRIGDYRLDVVPHGALVILRNRDVPGVIGRVGTLLGAAGINIGEYHQARLAAGGEALAVVNVDAPLAPSVIGDLRALPGVTDVRQVDVGDGAGARGRPLA
ncbi:MAG TPA: phosphoglycerate dehydrogenase [Gemmatimonadaceae bacterium]|nr:phosphoglycerate dehydrogenase [Gemmatimonadaceae bacterium]